MSFQAPVYNRQIGDRWTLNRLFVCHLQLFVSHLQLSVCHLQPSIVLFVFLSIYISVCLSVYLSVYISSFVFNSGPIITLPQMPLPEKTEIYRTKQLSTLVRYVYSYCAFYPVNCVL